MANPARGEVTVLADGQARTLRLTLGALAELEAELGCGGLAALGERFDGAEVRSEDVIAVLAAGLRGAGAATTREAVAQMAFEGGAAGAVRAATRLMTAAFTGRAS